MNPVHMTVREFFDSLRRGPYTSVGCYPVFWITMDGGTLSFKACMENAAQIGRAIRDGKGGAWADKQWQVVASDINWEDPNRICDHTNERIPSAYAEDSVTLDKPSTLHTTDNGLCLPGSESHATASCR